MRTCTWWSSINDKFVKLTMKVSTFFSFVIFSFFLSLHTVSYIFHHIHAVVIVFFYTFIVFMWKSHVHIFLCTHAKLTNINGNKKIFIQIFWGEMQLRQSGWQWQHLYNRKLLLHIILICYHTHANFLLITISYKNSNFILFRPQLPFLFDTTIVSNLFDAIVLTTHMAQIKKNLSIPVGTHFCI